MPSRQSIAGGTGPREINQMVDAIWPNDAGRPVASPEIVIGTAKERATTTYEAKPAVSTIHENNRKLLHSISDLNDQSLKALRLLVGEQQMQYAELPGDSSTPIAGLSYLG